MLITNSIILILLIACLVLIFSSKCDCDQPKHIFNGLLIPYDRNKNIGEIKTSLYVLTYNSPDQFETLLRSFEAADRDFLDKPRKILVDNSTKPETYDKYNQICNMYNFEHIKKAQNTGISGGRQFVAEHFDESDSEYYIFFEDDMNLHEPDYSAVCDLGLKRFINNLFLKSLAIMHQNKFDFLKLSFSEVYGNNGTQWAWFFLPEDVKQRYFPKTTEAPKINFTKRKALNGLGYLEGDYFYCNWPLWFSREGNKKVFLDPRLKFPTEQAKMASVFQLQKNNIIKSAVLELSPIAHDRFDQYLPEERKES